jgi:hypothetical protein
MTRKDYQKIAKAVSDTVTEWEHSWKTDEMTPAQLAVASLAEKLAVLFAQDNERFNPSKFYTACGLN